MSWWVTDVQQVWGTAAVVGWIFWIICSITLHELAHGWAAMWQGDTTPRDMGHMTWNPLVHMGPISLIMFAVIGIAWGMMPVDPSKFRWRRRGRIVVSGAGPAMNVALAIFCTLAMVLWFHVGPSQQPLHDNGVMFFRVGTMLNIVLALFNLLPVPPLDGSSILEGISMKWYIWARNPMFQQIGFFAFLIIFYSGIGSFLFVGAMIAIDVAGAVFGVPPN